MPVAGALHRERYLIATGLLRGRIDDRAPAIEVLAGTLALDIDVDTVVAVVGPAALQVDGRDAAVGACIAVRAGEHVAVTHLGPGPAYLALAGWRPHPVLGSVSTDTFSGLGPPPLARGAVLQGSGPIDVTRVGAFHRPLSGSTGPIRLTRAGHAALDDLAGQRWSVTAVARSGTRLVGGTLPVEAGLPSRPMVRGAVQATPSGEAVVLGPDGGLTGGYPVVGVVAAVDLDRVSLLAPGDEVAFSVCDVEAAAHAYARWRAGLGALLTHPDHLPH